MALHLTPEDEALLATICRRCHRSPYAHTLEAGPGVARCTDGRASTLLPRAVALAFKATAEFIVSRPEANAPTPAQPPLPFPA